MATIITLLYMLHTMWLCHSTAQMQFDAHQVSTCAYGTDLMQRRSFARVRARGHTRLSGTTLELKRYHTQARGVPHASSSGVTREFV